MNIRITSISGQQLSRFELLQRFIARKVSAVAGMKKIDETIAGVGYSSTHVRTQFCSAMTDSGPIEFWIESGPFAPAQPPAPHQSLRYKKIG